MMVATAITGAIVGVLASMFVFVGHRAAQSMSQNGVLLQAQALSEELERTVVNAQSCRVVAATSGPALMCILPATGNDKDSDGLIDQALPMWITPSGHEGYGAGKRVWIYANDNGGNLSMLSASSAKRLWRAYRNDSSTPTTADIDRAFSTYFDTGRSRWPLIDDVTFSVDANGIVTFTIKATKQHLKEARLGTGASNTGSTLILTRKVFCRNWRR